MPAPVSVDWRQPAPAQRFRRPGRHGPGQPALQLRLSL